MHHGGDGGRHRSNERVLRAFALTRSSTAFLTAGTANGAPSFSATRATGCAVAASSFGVTALTVSSTAKTQKRFRTGCIAGRARSFLLSAGKVMHSSQHARSSAFAEQLTMVGIPLQQAYMLRPT